MKTEAEIRQELKTWEFRQKGYDEGDHTWQWVAILNRIEALRWVLE